MVLILLRIRAGIPVIMMGETGCGKTALIRKLSELLNNGSQKKMLKNKKIEKLKDFYILEINYGYFLMK